MKMYEAGALYEAITYRDLDPKIIQAFHIWAGPLLKLIKFRQKEKAADWTAGTGKEGHEEVEYILSSSMNTDNNQINVPVKVHWKPAVHPIEPLNEDQPAKFPMPPISLSMEEHGAAEPSSKQLQSEAQHKMKDAKQKRNLGSAKDGEKHIQSPHRPKSLSLYSNKFH